MSAPTAPTLKIASPDAKPSPIQSILAKPAHFMDGYAARVAMMNFLEASYKGGIAYKTSKDPAGKNILIEHEQEFPENLAQAAGQAVTAGQAPIRDGIVLGKYARRLRVAAFENHVKPIVDKFAAYLLRNPPKRDEKKVDPAAARLKLDEFMREATEQALKFTEAWIGIDAAAIPTDRSLTEAQVAALDPKHKGKPYPVSADPRRIVDFDEDDEGVCTRVVVMETETTKASLMEPASTLTFFKEWTASGWVRYQAVNTDGSPLKSSGSVSILQTGEVLVKEESRGIHTFGVCPWHRMTFPFPIEDVAEINRAMFNMSSLLDEELWNSVFTQRCLFGIKPADLREAIKGGGNWLAFDNPQAKIETVGASDAAGVIQARIDALRDSLYQIVSMDASRTKNVAEAAEKKKRDMEALYTSLVKIVGHVEDAENWMLRAMKLIEDDENQSVYDRHFDVNSIADLMADIAKIAEVPFIPAAFKRNVVGQLLQKFDPFGDQAAYRAEIAKTIDLTTAIVDAVTTLKGAGLISDELAAMALGVPEDQVQKFLDTAAGHAADKAAAEQAQIDALNGDGGSDGTEDDGAGPEAAAGDDAGSGDGTPARRGVGAAA